MRTFQKQESASPCNWPRRPRLLGRFLGVGSRNHTQQAWPSIPVPGASPLLVASLLRLSCVGRDKPR